MSNPWELTQEEREAVITAADGLPEDYAIEREIAAQRKLMEWLQANSLEQRGWVEIFEADWKRLCESLGVEI